MRKAPLIMGILNVTPDSFSDGGKFLDHEMAFKQATQLVNQGADIIDVGGESTRPGAAPVSPQEEMDRVLPVIERISQDLDVLVSIDTRHAQVAQAALKLGASIVNDISGGADPKMAKIVRKHKAIIILMHMQGEPGTMQENPNYPHGVVNEVLSFLTQRTCKMEEAGLSRDHIWVDPGIGFGKSLEHNLRLLKHLDRFSGLADRVVIGTSRKSFLAKIMDDPRLPMEERQGGTLATNLWALSKGASVFRVHEVGPYVQAMKAWKAVHEVSH